MLKKILYIFVVFISLFGIFNYIWFGKVEASDSYYEDSTIDPANDRNSEMINSVNYHWEWVLGNSDFVGKQDTISWYVQKVLAYFLWIIAIIAVFVLLYGTIGIFSPKSEEWLQKSIKYIKWAVIALLSIALSWLFVMLIFYIYAKVM